MFILILPVESRRVRIAEDGLDLDFNGGNLHFRHTRGHADHHFWVWDALTSGWFSGDMFGISYRAMRFDEGGFAMASTVPTQFRPEEFLESVELLKFYSPTKMYLTHYGELSYSDKLAGLLFAQVRAYPEIAREFAGDTAWLTQRIIDFPLECLAPFNRPGGPQSFRASIEPDAQLNAQSLSVWQSGPKERWCRLKRFRVTRIGTLTMGTCFKLSCGHGKRN
ncbi:MAG: glyoxylase-like metal-dependent hydrolase (beta-lactamase superfamily II) [Halioglobus sp.]|jgi:glyoxylase-like metal-dependent hydrolase (beta-lactamase superfamily II)